MITLKKLVLDWLTDGTITPERLARIQRLARQEAKRYREGYARRHIMRRKLAKLVRRGTGAPLATVHQD